LPLGRDSAILDSGSFLPLGFSLKESIAYIADFKLKHHFPLSNLAAIGKLKRRKFKSGKVWDDSMCDWATPVSTEYPRYVKSILDGTLSAGTRHSVLMILISFCMGKKEMSQEETRLFLWKYLNKPGHQSRDLERSREFVDQDITALMRNYEKKIGRTRQKCPLSDEDVSNILGLTEQLKERGKFGHRAYSMQRLVFSLFVIFKARCTNELDLSYNLLSSISSKKRVKEQMVLLTSWGLLTLVRKEDVENHQSRRYLLNYQFKEGKEVYYLDGALEVLYGKSRLFQMYTRGIYERVTKPLDDIDI
jgi:hypothetical protein